MGARESFSIPEPTVEHEDPQNPAHPFFPRPARPLLLLQRPDVAVLARRVGPAPPFGRPFPMHGRTPAGPPGWWEGRGGQCRCRVPPVQPAAPQAPHSSSLTAGVSRPGPTTRGPRKVARALPPIGHLQPRPSDYHGTVGAVTSPHPAFPRDMWDKEWQRNGAHRGWANT